MGWLRPAVPFRVLERRVDRAEFEEQHFAASTLTTVSLPPNDLPNTLRASPQVSGNLHTTLLSILPAALLEPSKERL